MTDTLTPEVGASKVLTVEHECDVAGVIAGVTQFCRQNRFDEVFTAHVATAASELANNLWMYTLRGGRVSLALIVRGSLRGVQLTAEDDGPGIDNLALALTEGYSTGGGMGCGLSGVQRLMDEFEMRSHPGIGTRVSARKWHHPRI